MKKGNVELISENKEFIVIKGGYLMKGLVLAKEDLISLKSLIEEVLPEKETMELVGELLEPIVRSEALGEDECCIDCNEIDHLVGDKDYCNYSYCSCHQTTNEIAENKTKMLDDFTKAYLGENTEVSIRDLELIEEKTEKGFKWYFKVKEDLEVKEESCICDDLPYIHLKKFCKQSDKPLQKPSDRIAEIFATKCKDEDSNIKQLFAADMAVIQYLDEQWVGRRIA